MRLMERDHKQETFTFTFVKDVMVSDDKGECEVIPMSEIE